MHWVDRGPAPAELAAIHQRYGRTWVRYYRYNVGKIPSDSRWRHFIDILKLRFYGLCGYCEEVCKGEVDHFRPKNASPELVYKWTNWILACHDCNHAKGRVWPSTGYVDPCARSRGARPEKFFDFDIVSGTIIPASGLTSRRHEKAVTTIENLRLNEFHHVRKRLFWLKMLSLILQRLGQSDPRFLNIIEEYSSKETEYSSLTRAWAVARIP